MENDCLAFPGLECVIDAPAGRGSSVLAYTGYYPDQEDPRIRHRVLIRELFPYDPSGGILRSKENALEIEKRSEVLYTHYRESFLRANEVHSRMAEEIPGELDLHINTFTCNNTLYSVMGYTGGRSLEEEIRRLHDKLKLLRSLKIIRGALQVLRAFHETGYLHLDVSPDNILLIGSGDRERVTLIDYNSVHTFSEIRSDSSAFLSMKDGYTAPEVRMGQRSYIGPQSDLFSMTAVFWHCISGRKLSDLEQIGSVFPDPSGLPGWENLPASARSMLRIILRKGLSPSPRKRYGSVAEILKDLGELEDRINGRGITRWALWENGRARCLRLMQENISLQYIRDENRIYPLHVEKADGDRTELFDLLGISARTGRSCSSAEGEQEKRLPCSGFAIQPAVRIRGKRSTGRTRRLYFISLCTDTGTAADILSGTHYLKDCSSSRRRTVWRLPGESFYSCLITAAPQKAPQSTPQEHPQESPQGRFCNCCSTASTKLPEIPGLYWKRSVCSPPCPVYGS